MLEELGVMDQTAITLCKENALPLIVLNINTPGAVAAAIRGERVGTLVRSLTSTPQILKDCRAADGEGSGSGEARVRLGPLRQGLAEHARHRARGGVRRR